MTSESVTKREAVEVAARHKFETYKCSISDLENVNWADLEDGADAESGKLHPARHKEFYRDEVRDVVEALARAHLLRLKEDL